MQFSHAPCLGCRLWTCRQALSTCRHAKLPLSPASWQKLTVFRFIRQIYDCSKRFCWLIYDNRNSEKFNQTRAFGLYPSVLDESESRRAFGTHDTHVIQPCDSFDVAISVFKSAVTSIPLFDLKVCEGSSFQGIGFFDFRVPQETHSRENVFVTFGNLAIDWCDVRQSCYRLRVSNYGAFLYGRGQNC